jgi:hypothetical protein
VRPPFLSNAGVLCDFARFRKKLDNFCIICNMRPDLYIRNVLEKCGSLKRAGVWANESRIRPTAWLSNFDESEQPIAAVLLDHFVFASAAAVDRMLLSGYRAMRDRMVRCHGKDVAKAILRDAVFTAVEGEDPNVTDSGNLFCRKIRQIVSISESRFLCPSDAMTVASGGRPVIFVDDFVGSGDQFASTWTRQYLDGFPRSFKDAHDRRPFPAYYLTLVASAGGIDNISHGAPLVEVVATHVLNGEYSVHALPTSPLLPDLPDIPGQIDNLIEKYHKYLDVPPYLESSTGRKFGYHGLGFLFAFDHSTPDATIPLLWAEGPEGWTPLVRRT